MINSKFQMISFRLLFSIVLLLTVGCFFSEVSAQKRESLTEFEVDLIREAQEIDLRMKIFVKAIDRRLLLLENPNATQTEKEEEKFGELPKGTKAQLLHDIERLLDESINNLDDTARLDLKNKLLPKAVKTMVEACQIYLIKLKAIDDKTTDRSEKTSIINSIEYCNEIIEAKSKVPEPEQPNKKT